MMWTCQGGIGSNWKKMFNGQLEYSDQENKISLNCYSKYKIDNHDCSFVFYIN